MIGVERKATWARGERFAYWLAAFRVQGQLRRARFYERRHGKAGARRAAKARLAAWEEEHKQKEKEKTQ